MKRTGILGVVQRGRSGQKTNDGVVMELHEQGEIILLGVLLGSQVD